MRKSRLSKIGLLFSLLFFTILANAQTTLVPKYNKKLSDSYSISRLLNAINVKEINTILRDFVKISRPNRVTGSVGHQNAKQFITNYLLQNASSGIIRKQSFDSSRVGIAGENIIWEKNNTASNKKIILFAHYDTVLINSDKTIITDGVMPGADNNATGVSALLLLANVMSQIESPFSLTLVFLDDEDVSLNGSFAFASEILPKMLSKDSNVLLAWVTMLSAKNLSAINPKSKQFKLYSGSDLNQSEELLKRVKKGYSAISIEAGYKSWLPEKTEKLLQTSVQYFRLEQNHDDNPNRERINTSNDFPETLNFDSIQRSFRFLVSMVLSVGLDLK